MRWRSASSMNRLEKCSGRQRTSESCDAALRARPAKRRLSLARGRLCSLRSRCLLVPWLRGLQKLQSVWLLERMIQFPYWIRCKSEADAYKGHDAKAIIDEFGPHP